MPEDAAAVIVDFAVFARPKSQQAKGAGEGSKWQQTIANTARIELAKRSGAGRCPDSPEGPAPPADPALQAESPVSDPIGLTIIHLCKEARPANCPDIDNIIKPIQDALKGVVYGDDAIVSEVRSRRCLLSEAKAYDLTRLPRELGRVLAEGRECVYVRVAGVRPLEESL